MTEDEAQAWIAARWQGRAVDRLGRFVAMVSCENERQNLVARASLEQVWSRHVVDSAQLVCLAGSLGGPWIDVGTGGGFPGVVAAILRDDPTELIEPRRRRAEFLEGVVTALSLSNVRVHATRVEAVAGASAAILSARAVAAPIELLERSQHVLSRDTLLLLPRGRDAKDAVEQLERRWRGVFHVEQSITDPASGIIVGRQVERR